MQQREQRILQKLAEAREAQASAMTRFIQARGRVMQVEARLQALQTRLKTSPEANPSQTSTTNIPDTTPEMETSTQPVNTTDSSGQTDALSASETILPTSSSALSTETPGLEPLAERTDAEREAPVQSAEQEVNDLATSTLTPEQSANPEPISELMDEGMDEEETKKRPALRLTRPAEPAGPDLDEEEMWLATFSTRAKAGQPEHDSEARETGETDITTKIPVVRRENGNTQEMP